MEAGGDRDRRGRGVVPFVLPARMGIDVGVTRDDGHRLGPGGPERHDVRVERVRDDGRRMRRAASAGDDAEPASVEGRGIGRGITGSVHDANRRERDRADEGLAADCERDVHRPVAPPGLAELVGAVERVDDPHAVRRETSRAVPALLGQDRIIGA